MKTPAMQAVSRSPRKNPQQGFTLIEMMIVVALIGILSAVAIPAYSNYVLRARTAEAFTMLGGLQPAAEQYWANKRTFADMPVPGPTANFTYSLVSASDSAYQVKAVGTNKMVGLTYTIDQSGNRKTTVASGNFANWTTSETCWVDRKGGQCTQ